MSTDELDEEYDAFGRYERWPHGAGWGRRTDLNTGVVLFRATNGSKAFLQAPAPRPAPRRPSPSPAPTQPAPLPQAWRLAMLAKREAENTNDQFIFVAMVRDAGIEPVTSSPERMRTWRASLAAHGLHRPEAFGRISPSTRGVFLSKEGFASAAPCLPSERCAPQRFSLATLPLRVFTGGHTYFMQRLHNAPGHDLPRLSPLTVHFTFQYSDTPDYPHGKRQRAREAALWAVDPPDYYSKGTFLRLVGPLYSQARRRGKGSSAAAPARDLSPFAGRTRRRSVWRSSGAFRSGPRSGTWRSTPSSGRSCETCSR